MTTPLWIDNEWTYPKIKAAYEEIAKIGTDELGLDTYPNQIEIISSEQMIDAYTSIGMPIFYKHWSFGKQFSQEWDQYKNGKSGLAYELVINSDPCINYLMEENSMTTQALVIAHAAFGHNHFFKNNYLFQQWTDASGIVDYLIFARDYVAQQEIREGKEEVERFLDLCHALMTNGVNRYKRPSKLNKDVLRQREREREEYQQSRITEFYRILPEQIASELEKKEEKFPAQPEENLLYFFEKYAPELKPWQRELLRIVRRIAQYFYPQSQTKLMNEGFASYIHYTIMNRLHDKGLTTQGAHLEFLALHANVLFQPEYTDRRFSGLNPYKLGFDMLRDIERICTNPTDEDRHHFPHLPGEKPIDVIKDAVANFRDESFVRQYLSPKVVRDYRLFALFDDREEHHYIVNAIQDRSGFDEIREKLGGQYERHNFVPQIEVVEVDRRTRTLHLEHTVYRGRALKKPEDMIKIVRKIWGYPVVLWARHPKTDARDERRVKIAEA